MKIDKKLIKELTDYLNEFSLTEIEYSEFKANSAIFFEKIWKKNWSSSWHN